MAPADNPLPDHWSASDEDRRGPIGQALARARESLPGQHVLTPKGPKPYYPDEPDPHIAVTEETRPDNPFNPRGQPSLSLPQQATPLTSDQGVLSLDEMLDPKQYEDLVTTQAEDGLALDDPRNPRGTPDYIVEEPSPQSNPEDLQHDGRTSHTSGDTLPEPKRYWEDENPNANPSA